MKFATLSIVILMLMAGTANALDTVYSNRRQADSEYRIAEKMYRKTVREYGDQLTGLPASEKASVCRQVSSALHDNRWQYDREDFFTQPKYRKQIQRLESYQSSVGCN